MQQRLNGLEARMDILERKLAVFESWLAFTRFAAPIALGVAGLIIGRLL